MTKQEQNYLVQIQNTLMEINTKGNDTILMSECLKAINSLCVSEPTEEESVEEV